MLSSESSNTQSGLPANIEPVDKTGLYNNTPLSYQIHSIDSVPPSCLPSSSSLSSSFTTTTSHHPSDTNLTTTTRITNDPLPPSSSQSNSQYTSFSGMGSNPDHYNNTPASDSTTDQQSSTVAIGSGSVSREDAKRLHISNIPFKYRENDLIEMFQVFIIISSCCVLIEITKLHLSLAIIINGNHSLD